MNEIIKYNNYMNSLKFTGFTTTDFNFLMMLCGKMRDKDITELTISFDELRLKTGYTQHPVKQFVSDLKRMNDKLMKITCNLETETKIIMFVLFPTFEIDTEKQKLTVCVNEKFKFILNELVKNFTRFELNEFVKLGSKYSKTLYRLLKQFRGTGKLEVALNDFKEKMDCPKAYNNKQFMQNIITPALKELQNYFQDLQCTVKYEKKRGKPVSGYIFTFTPEPRELPAVTAKPFGLQERLTQKEKDKLIDEFGTSLTEKYIEKTSNYNKCCNYAIIRQWILEDREKKQDTKNSHKVQNQFNNFPQRDYSQEDMDGLEQILVNKF